VQSFQQFITRVQDFWRGVTEDLNPQMGFLNHNQDWFLAGIAFLWDQPQHILAVDRLLKTILGVFDLAMEEVNALGDHYAKNHMRHISFIRGWIYHALPTFLFFRRSSRQRLAAVARPAA
jgi:hypothetical protein